jgi:exosome complex RNA-binding protein Rrp42 (RNase PH superfamily)
VIVRHVDAKALGYCNAGLRRWFPRDGVSFDDFRRVGVTTEWLRASGDAMAIKLAESVEAHVAVAAGRP